MNEKSTVCFLRGINVSGKNMIKMADLTALFKGFGFADVLTYLQSGNVVFSNNKGLNESELSDLITTRIKKKLGFDVPVLFRTQTEIESILTNNNFINKEKSDSDRLYVTMLEEHPEKSKIDSLMLSDFSPERFEISGREVYLFCPDGYGRAKLNNNFFEKKLGITATTRNWNTIKAVADMMNKI
jgi:uncharacterized protein (DUF1697 family)